MWVMRHFSCYRVKIAAANGPAPVPEASAAAIITCMYMYQVEPSVIHVIGLFCVDWINDYVTFYTNARYIQWRSWYHWPASPIRLLYNHNMSLGLCKDTVNQFIVSLAVWLIIKRLDIHFFKIKIILVSLFRSNDKHFDTNVWHISILSHHCAMMPIACCFSTRASAATVLTNA